MTLLYFAWLRQKIGKSEEQIELPPHITTLSQLVEHLRGLGSGYADALADTTRIRAAVNQTHVGFDTAIRNTDEVAFFPPVTGG